MDWKRLISNKRLGQEERHVARHDDRSEFKRDYDRLIFSAPFRRMQNKTQVFPLPGSVFVHNRLTHSLEVASVGMSLGNDVARALCDSHPELRNTLLEEIGTIVSAACLAHDMGNPPFGHSGEKAIQTFFSEGEGMSLRRHTSATFWDDVTHFEGNANAFRLLTHRFVGRRIGGFVMTYSTLASIVKYPFSSSRANHHGKFGFFCTESDYYQKIADELGIIRKSKEGSADSFSLICASLIVRGAPGRNSSVSSEAASASFKRPRLPHTPLAACAAVKICSASIRSPASSRSRTGLPVSNFRICLSISFSMRSTRSACA